MAGSREQEGKSCSFLRGHGWCCHVVVGIGSGTSGDTRSTHRQRQEEVRFHLVASQLCLGLLAARRPNKSCRRPPPPPVRSGGGAASSRLTQWARLRSPPTRRPAAAAYAAVLSSFQPYQPPVIFWSCRMLFTMFCRTVCISRLIPSGSLGISSSLL